MTQIERTILANQFKILAQLDEGNAISYIRNAEILEKGIEGLYEEVIVSSEKIPFDICKETHEILTMYRVIENATAKLKEEDRSELDLNAIRFDGFDANNDPHYQFAKFIIEKMDLYESFQGRQLNSHTMASMRRYKRMLPVHKALYSQTMSKYGFTELQKLIEEVVS